MAVVRLCDYRSYPLGIFIISRRVLVTKRKRALPVSFLKYIYYREKLYRVNARKSGIYVEIMKSMLGQLFTMSDWHNKLTLIRFDLHQDHATDTSEQLRQFMRNLTKRLKRKYKLTRVATIWVRELEKGTAQHYHAAIIIDGNKVQRANEIFKIAEQLWHDQNMGNTFSRPPNPYYHWKIKDQRTLARAIWRISYLAKGRGKGRRPPKAKDYATSRIKPPAPKPT